VGLKERMRMDERERRWLKKDERLIGRERI
jgi:hypothetical protein